MEVHSDKYEVTDHTAAQQRRTAMGGNTFNWLVTPHAHMSATRAATQKVGGFGNKRAPVHAAGGCVEHDQSTLQYQTRTDRTDSKSELLETSDCAF